MRLFLFSLSFILCSYSLIAQRTVVHQEDFNENELGWTIHDDSDYMFAITDGHYHMRNSGTTGYYATQKLFCDPYSDFEIEARIKQVRGAGTSGYGLILVDSRRTGKVDRHRFLINGRSQYKVVTYHPDTEGFTTWKDWTDEPLEERITYRDLQTDEELGIAYSDKKTGDYQIILPRGRRYSFLAEEQGYFPVRANLDGRGLEDYTELDQDLLLAPVEVGLVVRLNNIFFEYDAAELLEESFAELDRLVRLMKDNPKLQIEMGGHTDSEGSDEYNLSLSQRRVESVTAYLQSKGIDPKRYKAVGYGEGNPVATNDTEVGRALNRRVEFRILKN